MDTVYRCAFSFPTLESVDKRKNGQLSLCVCKDIRNYFNGIPDQRIIVFAKKLLLRNEAANCIGSDSSKQMIS